MKPFYQLSIDGTIIELGDKLIQLTLTDNSGFKADELTLDIDDAKNLIELPKKGVVIDLSVGLKERDSMLNQQQGKYVVDEVSLNSPPQVISIVAHAANFTKTLLEQREISYNNKTLSEILKQIADRNALTLAISNHLSAIKIKHIDQNNQSDAHFLTRLAKDYGAIGTIKQDRLLFIDRTTRKTASGKDLPIVNILQNECVNYSYRESEAQQRVSGVVAFYQDIKKAKRKKAVAGKNGYKRHLKETYANKDRAMHAAQAEFKRLQANAKTLSISLAQGRADITPEMGIKTQGFKQTIDDADWVIKTITHSLGVQGFVSAIECEVLVEKN